MDDPHDPIDLNASAPKKVKKEKVDYTLAIIYFVAFAVVLIGVSIYG